MVVVAVLLVWIGTCAAAVVDANLVTLAAITTPVMTAAISGVFALELFERKGNGGSG